MALIIYKYKLPSVPGRSDKFYLAMELSKIEEDDTDPYHDYISLRKKGPAKRQDDEKLELVDRVIIQTQEDGCEQSRFREADIAAEWQKARSAGISFDKTKLHCGTVISNILTGLPIQTKGLEALTYNSSLRTYDTNHLVIPNALNQTMLQASLIAEQTNKLSFASAQKAINKYVKYKNKCCFRWLSLFWNDESYKAICLLRDSRKSDTERFQIASKYLSTNSERAFASELRKVM